MIEIEGPDGVVNEFPDGTSDEVIKRAMRKQYGAAPARPAPDYSDPRDYRAKGPATVDKSAPIKTFDERQQERADIETEIGRLKDERRATIRQMQIDGVNDPAAFRDVTAGYDSRIAQLEKDADKAGVGSTARTVGSAIGGVLGGIAGGLVPIPGVSALTAGAGSAIGAYLGSKAGSRIDVELAKTRSIPVSEEDAIRHAHEGAVEDAMWDGVGTLFFMVGGKLLRTPISKKAWDALTKRVHGEATEQRAKVAAEEAAKKVEAAVSTEGVPLPANRSVPEAKLAVQAPAAVRELSARAGGELPTPGQIKGKPGFSEGVSRAVDQNRYAEQGQAMYEAAESLRKDVLDTADTGLAKRTGEEFTTLARKTEAAVKARTRPAFEAAAKADIEIDPSEMRRLAKEYLDKEAESAEALLNDNERKFLRRLVDEKQAGPDEAGDLFEPIPAAREGRYRPGLRLDRATPSPEELAAGPEYKYALNTPEAVLDFLSGAKAKSRAMSQEGPPTPYFKTIVNAITTAGEEAYEKAARTGGSKKVYDDLLEAREAYRKLAEIKFDDDIAKALDKNPEDIGKHFFRTGNVSEIERFNALVAKGVEEGAVTKQAGAQLRESLARNFLREAINDPAAAATFTKRLQDEEFARTFATIMPGAGDKLAQDLDLLREASRIAMRSNLSLVGGELVKRAAAGEFGVGFASAKINPAMAPVALLMRLVSAGYATALTRGDVGVRRSLQKFMRGAQTPTPAGASAAAAAFGEIVRNLDADAVDEVLADMEEHRNPAGSTATAEE